MPCAQLLHGLQRLVGQPAALGAKCCTMMEKLRARGAAGLAALVVLQVAARLPSASFGQGT